MFGISRQAVEKRAKRESWLPRPRVGRGGGNEWLVSSMPEATRKQVADALTSSLCDASAIDFETCPAAPPSDPGHFRTWQRDVRDARLAILQEIQRLAVAEGVLAAERRFSQLSQAEQLAPRWQELVATANNRQGERIGVSASTLRGWRRTMHQNGTDALAPRPPVTNKPAVPDWLPQFLDYYRRPTKPSISWCHEQLQGQCPDLPSLRAVQCKIASLGVVVASQGRRGPREMRNLLAFVKRDFSELRPGDVYTADGTTFDAEVCHPSHGKPFRPEIISILDVATRRCVGWSVGLAEGEWLVADAIRVAVEGCGIPAIFYVDNGCGFKNQYLQGPGVGVLTRLGTTTQHSIPYRSQSRGVIEAFQKYWNRCAKELPAYVGRDMDKEVRQAMFKRSRKDVRDTGTTKVMLTWEQFVAWMELKVAQYNARPHSALPKIADPSTGRKRNRTPAEQWEYLAPQTEIFHLSELEAADMFRPYEQCPVNRCVLKLHNREYYAKELELHHGEDVLVGYDIHDARRVWVRDLDQRLICTAELDGHSRAYFPQTMVDDARERRAKGRLARIARKEDEILAELHGARPVIEAAPFTPEQAARQAALEAELAPQPAQASTPALPEPATTKVIQMPKPPAPETAETRFLRARDLEERIERGEQVDPRQAVWLGGYQQLPEYKARRSLLEQFGEAALATL